MNKAFLFFGVTKAWLTQRLFLAAAIFVFGAMGVANAQRPLVGSKLATKALTLAPSTNKSLTDPIMAKSWVSVDVGQWEEVCSYVSHPGYTPYDWDDVWTCEWEYFESWVDVWVEDDPDCSTSPIAIEGIAKAAGDSRNSRAKPTTTVDYFLRADKYLSAYRVTRENADLANVYSRQNFGKDTFGKWDRSVNVAEDGHVAYVTRGDGAVATFYRSADGAWFNARKKSQDSLTQLPDGQWVFARTFAIERYDEEGALLQVVIPGVSTYTLEYATHPRNRLVAITDLAGRSIRFKHDGQGRVSETIGANGATTKHSNQTASDPNPALASESVGDKGVGAGEDSSRAVEVVPNQTSSLAAFFPKAGSCPAPCQPWMRVKISSCISEAANQRGTDELACYVQWDSDRTYAASLAERIAADAKYALCNAKAATDELFARARCRLSYPQCFP